MKEAVEEAVRIIAIEEAVKDVMQRIEGYQQKLVGEFDQIIERAHASRHVSAGMGK